MNIYDLTQYVNQDVDDTFDVEDIVRWFNKAIASYNLVSPVTTYPMAFLEENAANDEEDPWEPADGLYPSHTTADYPLDDTFMLGVILPFISASVRGQESSIGEKQMFLQEFMMNARLFKNASNVDEDYLKIQASKDLAKYQVGENVYVSDMSFAPFRNDWTTNTTDVPEFKEQTLAEGAFQMQTPAALGDYKKLNYWSPAPPFYNTSQVPGIEGDYLIIYNSTTEVTTFYRLVNTDWVSTPYTDFVFPKPSELITGEQYYDVRTKRLFTWNNVITQGSFTEE
jgi:hypothetical protein